MEFGFFVVFPLSICHMSSAGAVELDATSPSVNEDERRKSHA